MLTFTVAGETQIEVRVPVPAEYADCSARQLVEHYRAASAEQRCRVACALESLGGHDLVGWLADEQTYQHLVNQPNIPSLAQEHRDWLVHVRAQIEGELAALAPHEHAVNVTDVTMSVTEYAIRLRHDTGHVTIWISSPSDARSAVRAVLNAEHAPTRSVVWVKRRPTCDSCDKPGTRYVRDSGESTPLCQNCAVNRYTTWTGMREHTRQLGITRFELVDEAEWTDQQAE